MSLEGRFWIQTFQTIQNPCNFHYESISRCYHEHLDLFTEIKRQDVSSLIETPFGGRYCGKIPPRSRISLYRYLSFVFNSDRDNVTEVRFSGTFRFIPDGKHHRNRLRQRLKIVKVS